MATSINSNLNNLEVTFRHKGTLSDFNSNASSSSKKLSQGSPGHPPRQSKSPPTDRKQSAEEDSKNNKGAFNSEPDILPTFGQPALFDSMISSHNK